ncbi:hypothetical protein [Leuconostoc citreum]|uniref:hypothetical protein n=1 Tax=Leuconostoc citreum TaxID=33964 RepID=UPI0012BA4FB9|nr:hypothetical protein [Leuconostoc citreum]QGN59891.1 hypothetical protein GJ636_00040 [Leuconostoc citreum]
MEDFETQMNKWLGKIGGLANLTIEEREEANTAAAEVLKKALLRQRQEMINVKTVS